MLFRAGRREPDWDAGAVELEFDGEGVEAVGVVVADVDDDGAGVSVEDIVQDIYKEETGSTIRDGRYPGCRIRRDRVERVNREEANSSVSKPPQAREKDSQRNGSPAPRPDDASPSGLSFWDREAVLTGVDRR